MPSNLTKQRRRSQGHLIYNAYSLGAGGLGDYDRESKGINIDDPNPVRAQCRRVGSFEFAVCHWVYGLANFETFLLNAMLK
jgi:hypothetical protein